MPPWLLGIGDAELLQFGGHVSPGGTSLHLVIDEEDLSVLANVERPARGILPAFRDDAIGSSGGQRWIAQDRVIGVDRFSKRLVPLLAVPGIATGGEVGDVELPDVLAALTERLALGRSATSEWFWEPGDHHRLFAFEIRELVGFAIAAFEREVRRGVTRFDRRGRRRAARKNGEKSHGDKKGLKCLHSVSR